MAQSISPLRIIAQPRKSYRLRYTSETCGTRSQRYIQADTTNPDNFVYPTIEISKEWHRPCIYIRVTLVTVPNERAPSICIHPYLIGTPDPNVIRDPERNSLYFPLTQEVDFHTGRKSFRISCKKLVQHQLGNYGQLRLLDLEQRDVQRTDDPNDARKLINTYQLGQSQFVFSIAELVRDGHLPIVYEATSVYSTTMNASAPKINDDDTTLRCAPQRGDWDGDDEVLMVIPKIDKRKTYKIYFDHCSMHQTDSIPIKFVDTKTITFITPPCPIQPTRNQSIAIPIVVIQNGEEIGRVMFHYQSFDECESCTSNHLESSHNSEQSYFYDHIDTSTSNNDESVEIEKDLS